jgi:hypothetical protein
MHIRFMVPLIGLAVVMTCEGCQAVKVAMPEPVAAPEVMSAPQGFAESYAKPPKQSGTGTAGKTGEPLT